MEFFFIIFFINHSPINLCSRYSKKFHQRLLVVRKTRHTYPSFVLKTVPWWIIEEMNKINGTFIHVFVSLKRAISFKYSKRESYFWWMILWEHKLQVHVRRPVMPSVCIFTASRALWPRVMLFLLCVVLCNAVCISWLHAICWAKVWVVCSPLNLQVFEDADIVDQMLLGACCGSHGH